MEMEMIDIYLWINILHFAGTQQVDKLEHWFQVRPLRKNRTTIIKSIINSI